MPDHFGEELAPLPAIAMAAAHTTTLHVGSLVFDNDYKHPAILAKEAATIDLLSDGRFEFGIGAGWMRADYDMLGLPYDPPAVRVDRFEDRPPRPSDSSTRATRRLQSIQSCRADFSRS